MGAVTGNRLWESLKYRIRDSAIKYSQQLQLDRAKEANSLEDRLSQTMEVGDSLAVDLARRDLELEASKHYRGFVVRNRLKRVSNEAVRCNAFIRKEELCIYTDRYIEFVKFSDGRISEIVLPAALTSRSRSFATIQLTSFASGWQKRLVVRVWLQSVKSVMQ